MPAEYLFFPMFALILLTTFTLFKTLFTRIGLARQGAVDPRYYKSYQVDAAGNGEPEAARILSRHFINLLEAPILFYVVCLAALVLNQANTALQIMAWAYVACRLVHSWIHLGSNAIMPRIYAYVSSWLVLLAMWGYVAVMIALGSGN